MQSVFKQGEQKGAAGDHAAAAIAFLRAAKEFPKDPRAAQACVNAELESQKAGDVATLKEAAILVTTGSYRGKPESPIGAWTAATTFQAMGLFDDAATIDEAMSQLADREHPAYQKYEHTKDAAYNAVILREAIGEHERAVQDGQRYLAIYGSEKEADEEEESEEESDEESEDEVGQIKRTRKKFKGLNLEKGAPAVLGSTFKERK